MSNFPAQTGKAPPSGGPQGVDAISTPARRFIVSGSKAAAAREALSNGMMASVDLAALMEISPERLRDLLKHSVKSGRVTVVDLGDCRIGYVTDKSWSWPPPGSVDLLCPDNYERWAA